MLEPHVLGEHWRIPSVFCRKHPPGEAMEGASLSDFTHDPLLEPSFGCGLPTYRTDIGLVSHNLILVLYELDPITLVPCSYSSRFVHYLYTPIQGRSEGVDHRTMQCPAL